MDSSVSKSVIKEELRKHWADQAVELALMGRWDEAVQVNMRILDIFPDDIAANNRLGKAYSELGRHEEAVTAYEQSLQRQPSNSIARKNLTQLYVLLNRDPQAVLAEIPDGEDTDEEEDEEVPAEGEGEEDTEDSND
jgi:Flp pilus assembly protein TadD